MKTARELDVWLYGTRIGSLRRTAPYDYSLEYSQEWASSPNAVPISLSLPLATRRHGGELVTNFLDNLLPDNEGVRDRWAREAGLASTEPFLLLGEYGRDVAGALQFSRPEIDEQVHVLRPLDDVAIADRIAVLRNDATAWLQSGDDVGRFSLGGAQSKFALARNEEAWYEPSGSAPATHIFKPVIEHLADGDAVEFIVMKAASMVGLETAKVELSHFENQRSLVVERFDRYRLSDGTVERVHQEDVLQALGRGRLQKYETHGGPSYRTIIDLLDAGWPDDAGASKQNFARALAYSWVMLSTDAHAKNYAILPQPDSLRLAPLYDVSSLIPYVRGKQRKEVEQAMADTNLAMSILGSYRAGDVSVDTWEAVARDARLDSKTFVEWVRDLCERIADVVQDEIRNLDARDQTDTVETFNRRIRVRATQAARAVA